MKKTEKMKLEILETITYLKNLISKLSDEREIKIITKSLVFHEEWYNKLNLNKEEYTK